jgi:hypothetical protein
MSDVDLVKWVVANVGVCGLLFLVWYLYHKSQTKAWAELQKSQAEQQKLQLQALAKQQEVQLGSYASLIEGHKEREDKNFRIMERYAEVLEYHGACMARVETKIDQNKFCPMVRRESGQ